ncbi:MAG: TetR family transcriptional regulator [Candidatus Azobacteroides sp.]|nr:TetR family transcriptional regulator [Candidatus Azobacteroides sp.]
MKVAIIAEGRGDLAVITNILKGKLNIDKSEIFCLLPEYEFDQTDLAKMDEKSFSSWTLVKSKCQNRDDLDIFLGLYENAFLVIQIDTAERGEKGYDVGFPQRVKNQNQNDYCTALRGNVICKINEWLENDFPEKIAYAICIEEIEAWIMTLYGETGTSKSAQPKETFNRILNRKFSNSKDRLILLEQNEFLKMEKLSKSFAKKRILKEIQKNNKSMDLFCDNLQEVFDLQK